MTYKRIGNPLLIVSFFIRACTYRYFFLDSGGKVRFDIMVGLSWYWLG